MQTKQFASFPGIRMTELLSNAGEELIFSAGGRLFHISITRDASGEIKGKSRTDQIQQFMISGNRKFPVIKRPFHTWMV